MKRGNTRKVLLLNLVQLLLLIRRRTLGYISHREIRRWRAAAVRGLLGVVHRPCTADRERQLDAVSRMNFIPEDSEDLPSSDDNDDLLTMTDADTVNDPEEDDSSDHDPRLSVSPELPEIAGTKGDTTVSVQVAVGGNDSAHASMRPESRSSSRLSAQSSLRDVAPAAAIIDDVIDVLEEEEENEETGSSEDEESE